MARPGLAARGALSLDLLLFMDPRLFLYLQLNSIDGRGNVSPSDEGAEESIVERDWPLHHSLLSS